MWLSFRVTCARFGSHTGWVWPTYYGCPSDIALRVCVGALDMAALASALFDEAERRRNWRSSSSGSTGSGSAGPGSLPETPRTRAAGCEPHTSLSIGQDKKAMMRFAAEVKWREAFSHKVLLMRKR